MNWTLVVNCSWAAKQPRLARWTSGNHTTPVQLWTGGTNAAYSLCLALWKSQETGLQFSTGHSCLVIRNEITGSMQWSHLCRRKAEGTFSVKQAVQSTYQGMTNTGYKVQKLSILVFILRKQHLLKLVQFWYTRWRATKSKGIVVCLCYKFTSCHV